MKRTSLFLTTLALLLSGAPQLMAHCQIPCGIFDDAARFASLREHVTTIEKSMKQATELSAEGKANFNQIVRWINNKDQHADELAEIVTYYFMAQRIKPADHEDESAHKKYLLELTTLHQMLIHAMKAKQSTDLGHVEELRKLIDKLEASYLTAESK
jgi:nickel superoxide dismutase